MLLHKVSVGVRQAKLAREGCNKEQSLKYVYKDYLASGTPTSSAATLIIFPAQFSAWANQIRWRWTLVSQLVQCQTSNSPQQGRKWDSSPLHHYQVPCKSVALSQLSYLTRSAWSCFQVYVWHSKCQSVLAEKGEESLCQWTWQASMLSTTLQFTRILTDGHDQNENLPGSTKDRCF